jgi:hypothetical protein
MTPAWAQRKEELWSDCIVSPDVFNQMVDRLGEFVVPYQQAMETEAGQHPYGQKIQNQLCGRIYNPALDLCCANLWWALVSFAVMAIYFCPCSRASISSRIYWSTSRPVVDG